MGERVVVALVKFGASSKLGTLSREPYNVVYVYRITRLLYTLYLVTDTLYLSAPCPSPVPAALPGTYLRIVRAPRRRGALSCPNYF